MLTNYLEIVFCIFNTSQQVKVRDWRNVALTSIRITKLLVFTRALTCVSYPFSHSLLDYCRSKTLGHRSPSSVFKAS